MAAIKRYDAKKNNAFAKLQAIYNLSLHISDENKRSEFMIKAKSIDIIRNDFTAALDSYIDANLDADPNYSINYQPLNAFDELYDKINALYLSLEEKRKIQLESRSTSTATSQIRERPVKARLPKIAIPEFDGSQENWPLFYQPFKHLIHDDPEISKLEKINYLLGSLKGSARSICWGTLPVEENYDSLFQSLVDRYEDKRAIAVAYLDKILNFKALSLESEKGLHLFLEQCVEATNGLKQLQLPDLSDFILTHLALKKLDAATIKQFEMSYRAEGLPTFEMLVKFLKEQAKILGRLKNNSKIIQQQTNSPGKKVHCFSTQETQFNPRKLDNRKKEESYCSLCSRPTHQLYLCPVFRSASVLERWSIVKKIGACFNCLSPNTHRVAACKSKNICSKCNKKHHTMLHNSSSETTTNLDDRNSSFTPKISEQQSEEKPEKIITSDVSNKCSELPSSVHRTALHANSERFSVLLSTAVVIVTDIFGNRYSLRALLDPGSQLNFIRRDIAQKLNLNLEAAHAVIRGIASTQTNAHATTSLTFSSNQPPHQSYDITALVVNEITDLLPVIPINVNNLPHVKHLALADPHFSIPGKIDILLGAELWPLVIKSRRVVGPPNTPTAFESTLGYLLMGKVPIQNLPSPISHNLCSYSSEDLRDILSRFWTIEEVPSKPISSPEENECEQLFQKTYSRKDDGRFCVALPFKKPANLLGYSKPACVAKFLNLERRLLKDSAMYSQYKTVIKEYLSANFISLVKEKDNDKLAYFMPHHEVFKPESITTPLRIVFNASAPSSSGWSLNSLLYVGPKLQADIFDVLLNFRLFSFALTSDISKMYLQIEMNPEHRKYQRFIWRFSPEDELKTYQWNTVVFGISSSPFLAQRVLRELAYLEEEKYPSASEVLKRDIYIDDLVTSTNTEDEAMNLFTELVGMVKSGGFNLSKWNTNAPSLSDHISEETKFCGIDFDKENGTKVLGMRWAPSEDVFTFKVFTNSECKTKRSILSAIARIYDPLGFVAPVLTTAKLIMKDLWVNHIGWDESLPEDINKKWNRFYSSIDILSQLNIPRHTSIRKNFSATLVGFSDASEKAYGAVVYVITYAFNQENIVRLLCAKSKVAPMKILSIPRLELCASVLLAKLIGHVLEVYNNRYTFDDVIAFSDSKVVLHWLNASPNRWKIFVANRVSFIQEILPSRHWRHVGSGDNPADCLSRGLLPTAIIENNLWFSGPSWLKQPLTEWAKESNTEYFENDAELEAKSAAKDIALIAAPHESVLDGLLVRCSSLMKLFRITAYVLRFIKQRKMSSVTISLKEIEDAELIWLKITQYKHFANAFHELERNVVPANLRSLDPFIYQSLIRIGGRLNYADLPYDQRHPVLLPKKDKFVELLIDDCHIRNAHAGPHYVFCFLRLKYWIISARVVIRSRTRKCNVCYKVNPKPVFPKMAPLPSIRFQEAKAFARTGVDYAGPYNLTMYRRRGAKSQKAYICLFICLSVKAVHLELVSELSTSRFLEAFKRFLSRRGPCYYIRSDCGTNFVGASKELDDLHNFLKSPEYSASINNELTTRRVEWHFNPPSAPHFGGLWEANIKTVKMYLRKIIGSQILSYEEFYTFLVQVEAIVNSRPLCTLSDDVQSPTALTPAHFLTLGSTLDYLPSADVTHLPINRLSRYQLISRMVQDYWKRWNFEHLQSLQRRQRWTSETTPVRKGTVVILMKENTPPLTWPLGVIEDVHPGNDGVVRVVSVRIKGNIFKRPVVKICPLPSQ